MPEPKDSAATLLRIFQQINSHWLEAFRPSAVTDERILRELSLPADGQTRLCYFALPPGLIAFYREAVFPLVDRVGFVPSVGNEIDPYVGSVHGLIESLLSRAPVVIADVSTDDLRVWSEVRSAAQRSRPPKIALVMDEGQAGESTSIPHAQTFVRQRRRDVPLGPEDGDESEDEWLAAIVAWLDHIWTSEIVRLDDEAQRLLNQGEYRAAVIAASSAVEVVLSERVASYPTDQLQSWKLRSRPSVPFHALLQDARAVGIISPQEEKQLRELQRTRNTLVHTREGIHGRTARSLVNSGMKVVERLRTGPNAGPVD